MTLSNVIRALNKNSVFRFFSSVRLAVPLMIVIIVSVAAGTIFESLYNSAYARLAVYNTWWFASLMVLLWLNIFCAMMSRYPWKKHHTGFVITHIGLLTLLFGGYLTGTYGIDGTLQIPEGQSNSVLVLPRLRLAYQLQNSPTPQFVVFERSLNERSGSSLDHLNSALGHVFTVEKFVPFAQVERSYASAKEVSADDPVSVSFVLKNKFFNVNEWLHSADKAEMQLGPATLKLIKGNAPPVADKKSKTVSKAVTAKPMAEGAERLLIRDKATGQDLKTVTLAQLKKGAVQVNGVTIKLKNRFVHAVVRENRIGDDPASEVNPALEITLQKQGEEQRDVVYAKYADFSLNKKGNFGLSFQYEASAAPPAETGAPAMAGMGGGGGPNGNTVEFYYSPEKPKQVHVVLIKNQERVAEKVMSEGDAFDTPWMGMTIFVGSIVPGSRAVTEAKAVKPEPGQELPPSAVFVKPAGQGEGFWLSLGETKELELAGRPAIIGFTNETLELPFELKLEKFTKVDYPGTNTAMSYESLVELSRDKSLHKISMNEPLYEGGFTLYQSSYSLNPGQPPVTILSVNRDPGRPVKYGGSIVLAIGIITFTLMRSRVYRSYGKDLK